MVENNGRYGRVFAPAWALGMSLAFVAAGCSGDDTGKDGGEVCVADPNCESCVQDEGCCEFSLNCQVGSICNLPTEEYYKATKPEAVCIRLVCNNDTDCDPGEACSRLLGICVRESCQSDTDCPGGQICVNSACGQAPGVDQVASCEVVSRDAAIRQGQRATLAAVARNANGAVLVGINFEWTSSNANVVSVDGQSAVGGGEQGTATLTAKVAGRELNCGRMLRLTNYPNVGAGSVRVVVVADDDGSPVGQAQIVAFAGANRSEAMTDASGAATIQVASVDSITVAKAGWQFFTILQPGTNDILIPLPRNEDPTKAGGFRGVVDISATRRADIQLGLAGPAIPSNLLDFGLESLLGDFVPTTINAEELGLNDTFDLPGGLLLGLGSRKFTSDGAGIRCQGVTPSASELGCYLAQSPRGPGAGWALAGQLKLAQVTSIANELSGAIGGGGEDIPIGDILTAVLPLLRTLNHAVAASTFTTETAKVNRPGQTGDCADPTLADYDDKCWANFSSFERVDMAASAGLNVLSRVTVPRLPDLPGLNRCAQGAILLAGVNVPGRGLVPLGLSAGIDTLDESETPDCTVAGLEKPFGPTSADLNDGEMALSAAPRHSGIENAQLFLLALALDPDSIASETNGGFQLSALVKRVAKIGDNESITGAYLPFPTGSVNRATGEVAMAAVQGATLKRVELQRGGNTWLIYMPASANTASLPDVTEARQIASAASSAFFLSMSMEGNYSEVFQFGSGKTLDRIFDTVTGFVVQECSAAEGAPCRIQ